MDNHAKKIIDDILYRLEENIKENKRGMDVNKNEYWFGRLSESKDALRHIKEIIMKSEKY